MWQHNLKKVNMSASEFKQSEGYRDIQSTTVMYSLMKDATLNKLIEYNISIQQKNDILKDETHKEIVKLNKLLAKKTVIDTDFATTKEAAAFLRCDPSFLTKKQGNIFKLGVHFYKPTNSIVRWSLEALSKWMTDSSDTSSVNDDELAELLERR